MAPKKKDKKKQRKKQRKSRAKPGKKKPKPEPEKEKPKERESYRAEGPTKQTTVFLQVLAYGEVVFQVSDREGRVSNEITLTEFINQLDGNIEEQGKGAGISSKIRKELKKMVKIRGDMIKNLLPRYRPELVED